jgi:hypothetical protein
VVGIDVAKRAHARAREGLRCEPAAIARSRGNPLRELAQNPGIRIDCTNGFARQRRDVFVHEHVRLGQDYKRCSRSQVGLRIFL